MSVSINFIMQRLYDKMAFYDNLHFLKKYRFAKKKNKKKNKKKKKSIELHNYVFDRKYGSSAEISEYFSKMKY